MIKFNANYISYLQSLTHLLAFENWLYETINEY